MYFIWCRVARDDFGAEVPFLWTIPPCSENPPKSLQPSNFLTLASWGDFEHVSDFREKSPSPGDKFGRYEIQSGKMSHKKMVLYCAVVFKDRSHALAFFQSLHFFSPLQGSEGPN